MAESIVKDFKGKADWVYVGKAEAPKLVEKKADTLFNEYMQRVLDVAAPVGVAEVQDVVATQGAIAEATTAEIVPQAVREGATDKPALMQRWVDWEKKHVSTDHQERLGKLLTAATYMAGSFAANFGTEMLANTLYRSSKHPWFADKTGNKRMLDAGWEYLTDFGIEKSADWTAKKIANREDIGFVSPLSRMLGKIGNTIMNVSPNFDRTDPGNIFTKSLWNPGVIEGFFRFAGAVPGGGFIKEFYGKANAQIMKGEGIIPMGTDLAFNMIFAKMAGPMSRGTSGKQEIPVPGLLAEDMMGKNFRTGKSNGPFE